MENIYSENRKSAVSCQQIRFANDSHAEGAPLLPWDKIAIAKERKKRWPEIKNNTIFDYVTNCRQELQSSSPRTIHNEQYISSYSRLLSNSHHTAIKSIVQIGCRCITYIANFIAQIWPHCFTMKGIHWVYCVSLYNTMYRIYFVVLKILEYNNTPSLLVFVHHTIVNGNQVILSFGL